ncbi:hypothetical protein [Rubellicoccus peritrichatus]|uniref:Uncharacterized protein n=1 Tax=Rubellicoccus peritrichatus TaxID=3080537 RepID=A0AAQ3QUS0_9BACT|nr:hypothetical protein [Puniceicoccus sp. CR14]WOO42691.1 hypothetical protein RZN69_06270 [Puniceicoccus sp. CR14]
MSTDYSKAITQALNKLRNEVGADNSLSKDEKESYKMVISRMRKLARDEASGELPDEAKLPSVDTFLIALQKSISRVSRDSAEVAPDQARSLISGSVAFDVSLQCDLEPLSQKLYLTSGDDGYPLKLVGNINTDVDIDVYQPVEEETENANVSPDSKEKDTNAKRTKKTAKKKKTAVKKTHGRKS